MSDESMMFALQPDATQDAAADQETTQFLIFNTDGLLFGANVDYVVEIITNHAITHLPMVPGHMRGILNLRGQIVPVIDIRLLMGKEYLEDCITIVLDIEGTLLGILVDSVAQMVSVPKGDIMPVPAHNTQKLVSGLFSLSDSTTMMVFDCQLLLESE